jgi:hypothetical protein
MASRLFDGMAATAMKWSRRWPMKKEPIAVAALQLPMSISFV